MSQQLFYLAMSGLDATMDRVTAAANNLANRGTIAFKAQKPIFQALPLYGQGLPNRVMVAAGEEGADFRSGTIQTDWPRPRSSRSKVPGWIVVQASDGSPALTRNGALTISPGGMLQNNEGQPVLGQGFAPISYHRCSPSRSARMEPISGALAGQTAGPDYLVQSDHAGQPARRLAAAPTGRAVSGCRRAAAARRRRPSAGGRVGGQQRGYRRDDDEHDRELPACSRPRPRCCGWHLPLHRDRAVL